MAIRTALWKVSAQPQASAEAQLLSEKLLDDMIVAVPKVLSDEWMLIGRQESTGVGGVIALLAAVPDGSLVLIELKRDRTPRDDTASSACARDVSVAIPYTCVPPVTVSGPKCQGQVLSALAV